MFANSAIFDKTANMTSRRRVPECDRYDLPTDRHMPNCMRVRRATIGCGRLAVSSNRARILDFRLRMHCTGVIYSLRDPQT